MIRDGWVTNCTGLAVRAMTWCPAITASVCGPTRQAFRQWRRKLSIKLHELGVAQATDELNQLITEHVVPLYALRTKRKGYEVSAMKTMLNMIGLRGGVVRLRWWRSPRLSRKSLKNSRRLAAGRFPRPIIWADDRRDPCDHPVCAVGGFGKRLSHHLTAVEANVARFFSRHCFLGSTRICSGQGLGGALGMFFISGIVGFGLGDYGLFQAYRIIGSRLAMVMTQCLAAPFARHWSGFGWGGAHLRSGLGRDWYSNWRRLGLGPG